MSARRTRGIVAAAMAAGLVVVQAGPAMAASTAITSSGPLTRIEISDTLNCAAYHMGETQWYSGTACGTFVALNGTLFGPGTIPAGTNLGTYTHYTPVSQTGVTGSGTASDPYTIITIVRAGSLAELTQTDRYVQGHEFYTTDVQVTNISGAPLTGNIYSGGDCYLGSNDAGYGRILGTSTPACSVTQYAGSRLMALVPRTGGNNFYQAGYSRVWSAIGSKAALPDTCECTTYQDNGMAISWPLTLPAGGTGTWGWSPTFSPEGNVPLIVSAAADQPASSPDEDNGFTISIYNGNAQAATVDTISVSFPSGFSYISGTTTGVTSADPTISDPTFTWTGPFALSAGGQIAIHFEVRVPDVPGRNTIDADATADRPVTPAVDTAPVVVQAPADLSITKTASPTEITPGEPVTYTLTAHNDGPATATGVVIDDVLPDGFTFDAAGSDTACVHVGQAVHCDIGDLAPEEDGSAEVAVTTSDATPVGFAYNNAVVSAPLAPDPDPLNNEAEAPVLVRASRLLIEKTAQPAYAGNDLTWTLNVLNAGTTTAAGAVVTDPLPDDLTFVRVHTDSGECSFDEADHTLTCALGTLEPDGDATITLVTSTPPDLVPPDQASTTVEDTASVSRAGETDTTTGQVEVFAAAHLVHSKTVPPRPLIAGSVATYRVSVTNEGPSVATSIRATDVLPANLTFDAAASDHRCALSDEATNTVTCDDPGPLDPADSVRFRIAAQVSALVGDFSVLVNVLSATAAQFDPNPAPSTTLPSIVVRRVSLDVTKVPSKNPVRIGEQYFYTITLINRGPSAADNVIISDRVTGIGFRGGLRPGAKGLPKCVVTGVGFKCLIPSLRPDNPVTLIVPAVAPRWVPTGTVIHNVVTATSADRGVARAAASVLVVRPHRPVRPRPVRPHPVRLHPVRPPRLVPTTG